MCKLIFVKGIMGSGKSTTAKFVAEELERSGTPVRLVGENAKPHPVQMADPEEFESIDAWMTERLGKLEVLVDSILESGEKFVLDGQLFHESVDSLFCFDVAERDIVDFMTRTMAVLEKVKPALIYFYQADVRASLRRTCDARSEWWTNWQIDWKVHNRPYGQARGLKDFDGYVQLYS
ncbi:MAG: AAA family ATPase, partial [Candidatus Latescibacterota bacterium]